MCNTQKILFWSDEKKIKDRVLNLANSLGKDNDYRYVDFCVRLEAAYYMIIAEKNIFLKL